MGTPSAFRFRVAVQHLEECEAHIKADELFDAEHEARERLVRSAVRILKTLGVEIEAADVHIAIKGLDEAFVAAGQRLDVHALRRAQSLWEQEGNGPDRD